MAEVYATDPVIRWEQDGPGWFLRDTRTGQMFRSRRDEDPPRPYDVGYLGRLPRPDGNGTLLAVAGVHSEGSLGVVHLLAIEIGNLWGSVGADRFSVVVGAEYDPTTHEPLHAELLTPVYPHDEERS